MNRAFLSTAVILYSVGCSTEMKLISTSPATSAPSIENRGMIRLSGEFKADGYVPWTNGMTLRDGILAVGGLNQFAGPFIIVRHPDGAQERYQLGRKRNITINPILREGDCIISPRQ